MNAKFVLLALAATGLTATQAIAAPVTLTFEGADSFASVGEFYSDLGVSFAGDALALSNDELGTYFSNAPSPGTIMTAVGGDAALNAGPNLFFTDSASFYYSSAEATSVGIFTGLNGTGTLLGTFLLAANATAHCTDSPFCNWDLVSLVFGGAAQSIQFGTTASLAGFDNITVNVVPLPAAVWLLLSALGGLGLLRRRSVATA